MKTLVILFFCIFLSLVSGCSRQSQSEIALEFIQTGKYELLSDEDKSVYTKDEFESFWKKSTDLSLEPTSKYFEVETYLKSLITFKVKAIKNNEVIVTTFYPNVLSEIWFDNLDLLSTKDKEKLENLYLANKKKLLDASNFKFTETDQAYKFSNTGLFLDLSSVKNKRQLIKKINAIEDSVKIITSNSHNLRRMALTAHTIDEFNKLLKASKDLESNIKKCADAQKRIEEISPEAESYSIDLYIKEANKVLGMRNQFYSLKSNIIFNDVKISESADGDLAIFGNYKYNGKEKIRYAHFIANFVDKKGDLIGTQNLEYFASDLFQGKLKSFGLKIKDQFLAKSASKVKIVPAAIF